MCAFKYICSVFKKSVYFEYCYHPIRYRLNTQDNVFTKQMCVVSRLFVLKQCLNVIVRRYSYVYFCIYVGINVKLVQNRVLLPGKMILHYFNIMCVQITIYFQTIRLQLYCVQHNFCNSLNLQGVLTSTSYLHSNGPKQSIRFVICKLVDFD